MTSLRYNIPDEFVWYGHADDLNETDYRSASYIVKLFGAALEQNDIWLKRDVDWNFASYYRATQDSNGNWEPVKSLCVTLTFKDSDKAMLFKLSHEEV